MKTFLFIYSLLFALPTFALDALHDERLIERYLIFTLCLFVLICLTYYFLKKMGFGVVHVTILDKRIVSWIPAILGLILFISAILVFFVS